MNKPTIQLENENLERAVIGCMLVNPREIDTVTGIVGGSDFVHFREVFRLLIEMRDAGELLGQEHDGRIVLERMREKGLLQSFGGASELGKTFMTPVAHSKHYAELLEQLSAKRRTLTAIDDARERIIGGANYRIIAEDLITELELIESRRPLEFKSLAVSMLDTIEELKKPVRPMIYSGLAKVDFHIGGFAGGELIVVSAKTSGGKSAFALQVADHNGNKNRPVLFLTFEMAIREEVFRIWSRWTDLRIGQFRRRDLTEADFTQLKVEAGNATEHALHFFHMAAPRWRDIERTVTAFRARHGLSLLVVDYIGLIQKSTSQQTTQEKTAETTAGLKQLAGQFDCPVMALVQINREAMKAKAVELHNMADSASVERDADIVLCIHQPVEANNESREIHVLKNRAGEQCRLSGFRFDGEHMRFMEGH